MEGGESFMMIMKGETLKNKISHDLFTVKKFDDSKVVMLEDEKGYARIWLRTSDLESFFEKIEWMER
jgi:hypothetical protein